jgi:hypothetical protein
VSREERPDALVREQPWSVGPCGLASGADVEPSAQRHVPKNESRVRESSNARRFGQNQGPLARRRLDLGWILAQLRVVDLGLADHGQVPEIAKAPGRLPGPHWTADATFLPKPWPPTVLPFSSSWGMPPRP